MAISPFQPMLLLLLASLFFLPALRAVDFSYCNGEGYAYGNITRVDLSPNPVDADDEPTITFFGFANNSSSNIYRGKIVVYMYLSNPYDGTDISRTLVTKEFDEHEHVIEHGKNFELSVKVPNSEANSGKQAVTVTLIDELGIYDAKPGPQERICFAMTFPSKYHEVPSSSP